MYLHVQVPLTMMTFPSPTLPRRHYRRCACRTSCLLQVFLLLGFSIVDVVRSQQQQQQQQVPGCDCPATVCDGGIGGPLAVCWPATANAPYIDTTTSDPICDVVDNSEEYQTDFGNLALPYFFSGNLAQPYFFSGAGASTGPYLPSSLVSTVVGQGTCADAYEVQSSCDDSDNPDDGFRSSIASEVAPNSCGQNTYNFACLQPDNDDACFVGLQGIL